LYVVKVAESVLHHNDQTGHDTKRKT